MAQASKEVYFVFMNFDPQYERLHANRSKEGGRALHAYLTEKHDKVLEQYLGPNSYQKRSSLAIVDGFAVEISEEQAKILRSVKEVRVVDKNQELG